MIITTNESKVEFGNVAVGSEFKIKASAKAFAILSSGLYSNKIKAIVRELSCNARDSHRAAGKLDTKFDVFLPTTLEPYFYVRDYGTGLSHDDVLDIYTTYFESTKSDSNLDIGGLGLGSKSPFSYTQNFTVTSYKDGVCSIYTAYINDIGFPAISLMSSHDTEEVNGVEVRFAVNPNDFNKFREEANNVFQWFDNVPNIKGYATTITPKTMEHIVDTIYRLPNNRHSASFALMGNVCYPINVPNAVSVLGEYAKLLENDLVIKFGIGEVDIQPSREGLSYDATTIKNILDKLIVLSNHLELDVKKQYDAIPNEWDKLVLYKKLKSDMLYSTPNMKYIAANPIKLVDGSGSTVSIRTSINIDSEYKQYNIKFTDYYKEYGKLKPNYRVRTRQLSDGTIKTFISVATDKDSVVFVNNKDNNKISGRLQQWVKNKSHFAVLVATPIDATKPMEFDKMMAELYNPPTIEVKDLPEQTKVVRQKVEYVSMFKTTVFSRYWVDAELSATDIEDKTKTYYYVELSNKDIVENGNKHSVYTYFNKYQGFDVFNDFKVYGIRKVGLAAIQKLPNWKPFKPEAKKLAEKWLTTDEVYDKLASYSVKNNNHIVELITGHRFQPHLSSVTSKPMMKAIDMFNKYNNKPKYHLHHLKALAKDMELDIDVDKKYQLWYNKYDTVNKELQSKYPMLAFVDSYDVSSTTHIQTILSYINSVK